MAVTNLKLFFFTLLLVVGIVGTTFVYAVSVSLDPQINLGEGDGLFPSPQIDNSGDNTIIIWRDNNQILLSSSTNSNSNFSLQELGDTGSSVSSGKPQVKISGDNVYSVWSEDTGSGADVVFRKSTDAGNSFSGETQLSDVDALSSQNPQLTIDTTNKVLAVWHDKIDNSNGNIVFKNGGTNAADVATASNILVGTTDRSKPSPQITSQDNFIYVAWQTNSNVKLSTSTNDGVTFNSINVGSTGTASDSLPQIASSENAIFVIWKDGINIQLAKISEDGQTIMQTDTIGDTSDFTCPPENSGDLVISGIEVYAVWCDDDVGNGDVMLYRSLDEGGTFTVTNLSDNTGLSTKPKVSAEGDNVLVAWSDGTPDNSNRDILVATSNDKGTTFNTSNISQNIGFSNIPQVALSSNGILTIWQDDSTLSGINWDIFFRSGELGTSSISFDKNQYRDTGIAKITLTGGLGDDPISATVSSDSNPLGIVIELDPIAESPGDFEGIISFDPNYSSDGVLLASEGDTITVTANSISDTSSIYPRTIDILSKISGSIITKPLDFGLDASVRVTDQNSNINPNLDESIIVEVSTERGNPSGDSLILKETGPDTGVFGGHDGPNATTLIFSTSSNPLVKIPFEMIINQTDARPPSNPDASNQDPNEIDSIEVDATSESDPIGIQVDLIETDVNTGIFIGTLSSNKYASDNSKDWLLIASGDIVNIENTDSLDMRILAATPPKGKIAISAINIATSADTATISYKGTFSQIEVCDCIGQGGGGGGLVRPSLVVNALAALGGSGSSAPTLQLGDLTQVGNIEIPSEIEQIILNHDSSTPASPMSLGLFDGFDYPLTINDQGFVLSGFATTIETQKLQINSPHTIKFILYESDKIQHFSLYTNLIGANNAIHQSDTQILYNDGQEIQVVDPNEFFESVSLNLNEIDDLKKEIVLEITFAKQMDTSDMIVRSWDPFLNSFDTHILDAIEVVTEIEESSILKYEEPIIEQVDSQSIPVWIKNNAAWWSDQQIGDSDFVSGIEYLIKNGIINVPGVEVSTNSGSTDIPDWIKNNAGWWAESLITDGDFIEAMQWLIGNGVIQI